MHQVISLHSKSNIHPFLILPPEIVGRLLTEIDQNILKSVQRLMIVSTEFNCCMRMAVRYVDKLVVSRCSILSLFTGVKHLEIQEDEDGNYPNVRMFSPNVWRILESLKISPGFAEELKNILNPGERSDVEEPVNIKNILNPGERSSDGYPSLVMPKLRSLSIESEDVYLNEEEMLNIDPRLFPSLRILELDGCMIKNVGTLSGKIET